MDAATNLRDAWFARCWQANPLYFAIANRQDKMASVVMRKAKELDKSEYERAKRNAEDSEGVLESWAVVRALVGQRHESHQQYALS